MNVIFCKVKNVLKKFNRQTTKKNEFNVLQTEKVKKTWVTNFIHIINYKLTSKCWNINLHVFLIFNNRKLKYDNNE